jgi:putative PIN family toxin of toxin-antitoxin system
LELDYNRFFDKSINKKMRIVLETNIFVSALKSSRGASYALISQLPSDQFQIVLSIPLYIEYQDVLTRPEHMSGSSTAEEILAFVRYICSIAHRQRIFFLWRPWLIDTKDDMILEVAVASQSQYIVTHNLRDFNGVEKHFGITPVTPGKFLNIIRK